MTIAPSATYKMSRTARTYLPVGLFYRPLISVRFGIGMSSWGDLGGRPTTAAWAQRI